MSGANSSSPLTKSSLLSTRLDENAMPPFRSSLPINSASAGISSRISMLIKAKTPSSNRRFVQKQPVKTHICHCLCKIAKAHRLLYVTVHPKLVRLSYIPVFPRGGQDNDRGMLCPLIRPYAEKHFHPVHLWQPQIQQYDLRQLTWLPVLIIALCENEVKGLCPILYPYQIVRKILVFQSPYCKLGIIGIVLYQQYLDLCCFHAVSFQAARVK